MALIFILPVSNIKDKLCMCLLHIYNLFFVDFVEYFVHFLSYFWVIFAQYRHNSCVYYMFNQYFKYFFGLYFYFCRWLMKLMFLFQKILNSVCSRLNAMCVLGFSKKSLFISSSQKYCNLKIFIGLVPSLRY